MPAERLNALLAALEAMPIEVEQPAPAMLGDVPLPAALRRVKFDRRRWLRPGLWVAHARSPQEEGWRTYVLHAPAGQRLPPHVHSGPELICVLAGAFEDERRYVAGDFVESAGGSDHSVTVGSEGPCVCLIAAKGRLRSSGLSKLFNAALSV